MTRCVSGTSLTGRLVHGGIVAHREQALSHACVLSYEASDELNIYFSGKAVLMFFFLIIIYFQHAPLHCYAILHACFIVYSSIVSVTLITRDYNGPFHNLSKSIEFIN